VTMSHFCYRSGICADVYNFGWFLQVMRQISALHTATSNLRKLENFARAAKPPAAEVTALQVRLSVRLARARCRVHMYEGPGCSCRISIWHSCPMLSCYDQLRSTEQASLRLAA